MRSLRALLVLGLIGVAAPARAQIVVGQVEAVGFPVPGAAGAVMRPGQWIPIRVRLMLQGTGTCARELRFEAIDLDGDRAALRSPAVSLSSEGGNPARRVWCYGLANTAGELPRQLDVIDERGATVDRLALTPCDTLCGDDLLVLDISGQKVDELSALMASQWRPGGRSDGSRDHYRNIVVSKMPAADLPERWFGLEAVDVVVWDLPDPGTVSIAQLDALAEWVRAGGQLVVGIGPTWAALRKSALGPLLPLTGEGEQVELARLDVFLERVKAAPERRTLQNPVSAAAAGLHPEAVRILGEYGGSEGTLNLITMRLVGSGRVVATAAGLRDLARAAGNPRLLADVIDLNAYSAEFRAQQAQQLYSGLDDLALQRYVTEPIGFGTATALRGLVAFLFVSAYILAATLASWWWLRQRRLTALSWTVFAAFAAAASVLSLATVAGMRSFSRGVQNVCVLDSESGATTARGWCCFGYRSPVRARVELSLPGEGSFLRPLSRAPTLGGEYYVTPARYAGMPARARLDDVLMRATLKQVEGWWQGELPGAIRGSLVAERATGRLTGTSWIASELPVDLDGAWLLYVDPRQDRGGVPRAAGLTAPPPLGLPPEIQARIKAENDPVPPALNVHAVQIGPIPANQRVGPLGAEHYANLDREVARWARGTGDLRRSDYPDATLWHAQRDWRNRLGAVLLPGDRPVLAGLLAATRNYYLSAAAQNPIDPRPDAQSLTTDALPELDVTHWLLPGQAVLLAWCDEPGPVPLQVDGRPQEAGEGLTFYRVRIPLTYTGQPPRE